MHHNTLRQKLVLWFGTLVFVFLTLRPPWVAVKPWLFEDSGVVFYEEPLGSHFIWAGLTAGGRSQIRVDFQRLTLEWMAIIVAVSTLLATLKQAPGAKP